MVTGVVALSVRASDLAHQSRFHQLAARSVIYEVSYFQHTAICRFNQIKAGFCLGPDMPPYQVDNPAHLVVLVTIGFSGPAVWDVDDGFQLGIKDLRQTV
ncbi:MAG: hypothetical protein ACK4NH_09280 [Gemmobacter sp.]